MCLSRLVRIEAVDADGTRAIGVSEGRTVSVSLAVLTFEGQVLIPGDWVLEATGLAVRRLTDEEAAAIAQARTDLGLGQIAGSNNPTDLPSASPSTKVGS